MCCVYSVQDSNLQPFCRISPNSTPGTVLIDVYCNILGIVLVLTTIIVGINVSELQWNPGSPELVGVCLSSGALYVLEVKEDVKVVTSQPDMMATCCKYTCPTVWRDKIFYVLQYVGVQKGSSWL